MSTPDVPPDRAPTGRRPLRQPGWVGDLRLDRRHMPADRAHDAGDDSGAGGAAASHPDEPVVSRIGGFLLLPIVWMKRVRRPSPTAAEHRAQEMDHHDQPPTFEA